jgi:hypothetical protein
VYLEGLKETQKYRIPDKPPKRPAVHLFEMPETAPGYREAVERYEQEMAARKQAEIDETLWDYRRVIVGQIVEMYTYQPFAATELREMATRILEKPAAVDALMKVIEEKGGLKDDPIQDSARSIEPPPEPRPWRWLAILGSNALGIVVAGLIAWIVSRRQRRDSLQAEALNGE